MKRFLPISLSLLLCHCGTEVGNGIAPEPKKTGASTGTATSAPDAKGESAGDISVPQAPNIDVFAPSFLAACASPFAESVEGTFVNATASTGFTVTINNDGKKSVSRINTAPILFTITAAATVSPYAIEALAQSPQVTCSAVTTQTLNDGALQRNVTLSNGDLVQWTLSSGKVISMKRTTSAMGEESWTKKAN